MSLPTYDRTAVATVTESELFSAASATGIDLKKALSQDDLATYLRFASSFEKACTTIQALPTYLPPSLEPTPTTAPRRFLTPAPRDNPLNAWSQQCRLVHPSPPSDLLKGRTLAVKANTAVAGADLNLGTHPRFFPGRRFPVPAYDATVVRRVLEAGAEVRGVGTCENLSLSPVSVTAETGPVRNPWDERRATGGSSSGCASLVGLRLITGGRRGRGPPEEEEEEEKEEEEEEGVDMAVGGDQGGSIRVPAHFGGFYGLKPTYGLVPYTGIAGLHGAIDHAGPMCGSVEDVALLLEVLAGADGMDVRQGPWVHAHGAVRYHEDLERWVGEKRSRGEWTREAACKGMRVGVLKEGFEIAGLDDGVERVVRAAVDRFRSLGAEVSEVSAPMHHLAPSLWSVCCRHGLLDCLKNRPLPLPNFPMPAFEPLTRGGGSSSSSSGPAPKTTNNDDDDDEDDDSLLQDFFTYISPLNPAIANALLNAPLQSLHHGPELTRKAQLHVSQFRAQIDSLFLGGVDLLVLPVAARAAPRIPDGVTAEDVTDTAPTTAAVEAKDKDDDGGPRNYDPVGDPHKLATRIRSMLGPGEAAGAFVGATLNTAGFNLTGHPAVSFPVGWVGGEAEEEGGSELPVGLQLVGRSGGEGTLLRAIKGWEVGGRALDAMLEKRGK